ncbi:MAG TPA: YdcF family protein [Bryobacteraceae bacterium]|nr:YdcF family protein [Bryobacteraceae bacterium]
MFGVAVLALGVYLTGIERQIRQQSERDEARKADVIVVMGAAAYRGKPSPVLKARLDHALFLFLQKYAPRVLTTGGAGGDPIFTEAETMRDYLVERGVPSESIIVEPQSSSTVESTAAIAEIMDRMDLHSCVLVSDGYHIFRAKRMLEEHGVRVHGSPRPSVPKGTWAERWLFWRQAFAYLLWQLGITI